MGMNSTFCSCSKHAKWFDIFLLLAVVISLCFFFVFFWHVPREPELLHPCFFNAVDSSSFFLLTYRVSVISRVKSLAYYHRFSCSLVHLSGSFVPLKRIQSILHEGLPRYLFFGWNCCCRVWLQLFSFFCGTLFFFAFEKTYLFA